MLMQRVLRRAKSPQSSLRKQMLRLPGHAAHARPAGIVTAAIKDGVA